MELERLFKKHLSGASRITQAPLPLTVEDSSTKRTHVPSAPPSGFVFDVELGEFHRPCHILPARLGLPSIDLTGRSVFTMTEWF